MQKRFLLNIILLLGINLLIKPFYIFGIDLEVQNAVGDTAYGTYAILFNFSYLFQIISDLGLQQFNNRNVAQNPQLLPKYLSSLLLLKLGLSALCMCIGGIVAVYVMQYSGDTLRWLVFLLLNQCLITLIFFLRSNIAGLQRFKLDSFFSVLDRVFMILGLGWLLHVQPRADFQIEWYIYGQTIAYTLTAGVVYLTLRRLIKKPLQWQWKPLVLIAFLKQSLPYALAIFLMSIYVRLDVVMFDLLLPEAQSKVEADSYAFAYRLLDAVSMVGFLFATLLLPMYAKALKEDARTGTRQVPDLLRLGFQLMWTVTVTTSVLCFFFASDIAATFLHRADTQYPAQILQLLMLNFNVVGWIYIFGTLLTAQGTLGKMNIFFGAGVVLNILLNSLLIPKYGAMGAGVATIATQLPIALAEMIWVRRAFSLTIPYALIARATLFVGLCILGVYGLAQLQISWILRFLLGGVACLVMAFGSGFLQLSALRSLKR